MGPSATRVENPGDHVLGGLRRPDGEEEDQVVEAAPRSQDHRPPVGTHQVGPILQAALIIGGIYIIMCLLLSWFANWLEKRTHRNLKNPHVAERDPAADDDATLTSVIGTQDLDRLGKP